MNNLATVERCDLELMVFWMRYLLSCHPLSQVLSHSCSPEHAAYLFMCLLSSAHSMLLLDTLPYNIVSARQYLRQ